MESGGPRENLRSITTDFEKVLMRSEKWGGGHGVIRGLKFKGLIIIMKVGPRIFFLLDLHSSSVTFTVSDKHITTDKKCFLTTIYSILLSNQASNIYTKNI